MDNDRGAMRGDAKPGGIKERVLLPHYTSTWVSIIIKVPTRAT